MPRSSATKKLATYRAKRNFKKTAEPSGSEETKEGRSYLIQKHAARRLHYDFRLEMDGVLKSWAVTKGPSLDPADKRLAVHVEDHPLAYGKFEGTIPQGEYGGGTVMLWDQGEWLPIGDAQRNYKKGNLTFELKGKRLKGRWHLVRMGRAQEGKKENWLLIKGKDKYAKTGEGDYALTHFQKSAATGRKMEQIAAGSKEWKSNRATTKNNPVLKKTPKSRKALKAPPDFVAPQLATLVTHPPQGSNWLHEIKFDGYRLLGRIDKGKVQLITRANNDWTKKFQSIADSLAELKIENALFDGEIVHQAPNGSMSFHGLQNALSKGQQDHLYYYIFDLLFLDGEDWRGKPLIERKEKLKDILKYAPATIHYSQHFEEPGDKVLSHACHIALEGIVSKRADRPYHSGRDEDWMKSKCTKEQEIVIGGYTCQPKHPGSLGALLTGYYEGKKLVYSGKCGTGFSHMEGKEILKKLKKLQIKTSPFESVPSIARRGAYWVKPEMVAQIHFSEWTPDHHMRHPSFQGLREDKPASEVVREKEKRLQPGSANQIKRNGKGKSVSVATKSKTVIAGVALSHPEKELYKKEHVTKADLAAYYEEIAPLILPHVAGRPISLMRCPQGMDHACFFQRHTEISSPFIKPLHIKGKDSKEPYLMIEDVHGLIALVQMDVLEIHVWGAKADRPDLPDRITFDFDPAPEVKFAEVKKAAFELRKHLQSIKLTSFLKVTGGKGLHVVVPFERKYSWDQVKNFSRAVAEAMAKDAPERFTINSRKEKRHGKIFIDYLRNGMGASAIAPYSTRARAGAPVALPIEWSELAKLKSAHDFSMKDALKRTRKNPWREIEKIKQRLPIGR